MSLLADYESDTEQDLLKERRVGAKASNGFKHIYNEYIYIEYREFNQRQLKTS